jgi:hypothetical protein
VRFRIGFVLAAAVVAAGVAAVVTRADDVTPTSCGKRYVAGGDHLPAGAEISGTQRYSYHLLFDHLKGNTALPQPWCLRSTAQDGATTLTYYNGGQLANTWNYQPDLITLTIGEQNDSIKDIIGTCFKKYRDPPHDFSGAQSCEQQILNNSSAWSNLTNQLITILQQYTMIMSGRPKLIVAVTGYPNPYPQSTDVLSKITSFCNDIEDSTLSCLIRWNQLPGALSTADQVIQKLNKTISDTVAWFTWGYQGRFVFVNPYDKFKGHSMKMQVKASDDFPVCHLCGTDDTYTDGPHTGNENFGSDDPWFVAQSDGTATPFYLMPADQIHDPPVVLSTVSQTTSGMGVHVNDAGQKCVSDLVWEAVKIKLGIPEAPASSVC